MKLSPFFEGDDTSAGNLTADLTIDVGAGSGDGIEKLDFGTAFDAELAAGNFTKNFTVAANDEVAGTID